MKMSLHTLVEALDLGNFTHIKKYFGNKWNFSFKKPADSHELFRRLEH